MTTAIVTYSAILPYSVSPPLPYFTKPLPMLSMKDPAQKTRLGLSLGVTLGSSTESPSNSGWLCSSLDRHPLPTNFFIC